MQLKILTPEKLLYDGKVEFLQVPGKMGSFGILKNHAPIISTLVKGQIKLRTNGQEKLFDIPGGVIEVEKNIITVLTEMS